MKDDAERRREKREQQKYGNEKPISLYPLTPEEALKRAMSVPPPKKPQRPAKRKSASER